MLTAFNPEDLKKTNSDPDGPFEFVEMIGFEVPTYIDPRYDLIPDTKNGLTVHRLNHHVPIAMRGPFRVGDLPDESMWQWETDKSNFCICTGKRKDGKPCRQKAINRSLFCGLHGGALHPGDRVIDFRRDIVPDLHKVTQLSRVQKVEMGLIPVQDLSDEEISGLFVIDDDGRKVQTRRLSEKIHSEFAKEMMVRMQDFMKMKAPVMLDVIAEIAENDLNEPADRFKAAQWMAERTLGKTPDVVIHGKTDKPYEQIFTVLETTSRDAYIASQRGEQDALESGNIVEAEVVGDRNHGSVPDSTERSSGGSDSDTGFDFSGTGLDQTASDDRYPVRDEADVEIRRRIGKLTRKEPESSVEDRLVSTESRKERLKEQRKKLNAAKNRRYAKRAMGLTSDEDHPWLADYKPIKNSKGQVTKYHMRLVLPDDQTEDLVDRITAQDQLEAVAMNTATP